MHRLFERAAARRPAARRRPGLEDQPAGADRGRATSACRSTGSPRTGRTTLKVFTATAVVGGATRRRRSAAPRRRPSRRPPSSAWRALTADGRGARRPVAGSADRTLRCPSFPRSRSSAAASPTTSCGRRIADGRGRPPAGGAPPPPRARPTSPRPARRRTDHRRPAAAASTCGWSSTTRHGDAVLAHLGMSGQMLVADAGHGRAEKHLRIRFGFADDGPELRFVDQRTFGGLAFAPLVRRRRRLLPEPVAHIARDPMDPALRPGRRGRRRSAAGAPSSSGRCWTRPWSPASATSTPTRRCGGPSCTGARPTDRLTRAAGPRRARPRPRR